MIAFPKNNLYHRQLCDKGKLYNLMNSNKSVNFVLPNLKSNNFKVRKGILLHKLNF